jgi:hypothetical protein
MMLPLILLDLNDYDLAPVLLAEMYVPDADSFQLQAGPDAATCCKRHITAQETLVIGGMFVVGHQPLVVHDGGHACYASRVNERAGFSIFSMFGAVDGRSRSTIHDTCLDGLIPDAG